MFKNQIISFLQFFCVICFASFSITALASDNLERTKLEQLAEEYVLNLLQSDTKKNYNVSAVPLDSRIRTKKCAIPLNLKVPNNSTFRRHAMVSIKCADENGWNLYIQVKIREYIDVVVASKNIAKDTVITSEDIELVKREKMSVRTQYVADTSLLLGSKSKRFISQHQIVSVKALCFVCKGDSVTIVANSGSFSVKTNGVALQNGTIGQRILVKNTNSNKNIRATVHSVGEVRVKI